MLLICVLGTLLLWPKAVPSNVDESIETSYNSVCLVVSEEARASGVLLESGYVLTASHVVDRDRDNYIAPEEESVTLYFPAISFETTAYVIANGNLSDGVDVALLLPMMHIPLRGSRLLTTDEYGKLTIGTSMMTIGMQSGRTPANITDGRIVSNNPTDTMHRNSSNSYYGSSGGGVFINNQLIGISVAIGYDVRPITVPIIEGGAIVGFSEVWYQIPMANESFHVSAPTITNFIVRNRIQEALEIKEDTNIYQGYANVIIFNLLLILWLTVSYQIIVKWTN